MTIYAPENGHSPQTIKLLDNAYARVRATLYAELNQIAEHLESIGDHDELEELACHLCDNPVTIPVQVNIQQVVNVSFTDDNGGR